MAEPTRGIHISSAVVSVLPRRCGELIQRLSMLPGVEVHHTSNSKIVIVLEEVDSGAIGRRLAEIATFEGVLSATMVFEQVASLAELGE